MSNIKTWQERLGNTEHVQACGAVGGAMQAEINELRSENERLRADAERYQWLRLRLQVRMQPSIAGEVKPSMVTRIGHAFFGSATVPGRGYLDPKRFEKECCDLDAAIDAARAAPGEKT